MTAAEGPFYSYETWETAWHVLRDFVIPCVIGREVRDAGDFGNVAGIVVGAVLYPAEECVVVGAAGREAAAEMVSTGVNPWPLMVKVLLVLLPPQAARTAKIAPIAMRCMEPPVRCVTPCSRG